MNKQKIKKKKIRQKKKEEKSNEKKQEFLSLILKLNVLFSYYNELGDEFSFINYKNEKESVKIVEDTNITAFINILFLGKSGSGKTTLINHILGEKKSLEGGTGFSTTSKNIIVYKKKDVPIRLYDVKGIENEKSRDNYIQILKDFNKNNSDSKDVIHAIFYCKEYIKDGTIIEEIEYKVFEKMINLNVKIIFIITKIYYDCYGINKDPHDDKTENKRNMERKTIEKALETEIKKACKTNKLNGDDYFKNNIKIYYVNLKRDYSFKPPVPVLGIDKVLSYFTELVTDREWEDLKNSCIQKDYEKCKEYCQKNHFLKNYSNLEDINKKNQIEATNYLKGLKAGAFFSGMIPGLDIGMEYFYKYTFEKKLESIYGFNYDEAKEEIKKAEKIKNEKEENEIRENIFLNSIESENNKHEKETDSIRKKRNVIDSKY